MPGEMRRPNVVQIWTLPVCYASVKITGSETVAGTITWAMTIAWKMT